MKAIKSTLFVILLIGTHFHALAQACSENFTNGTDDTVSSSCTDSSAPRLTPGANLTIPSGVTLTITNALRLNAVTLTVEDGGFLIVDGNTAIRDLGSLYVETGGTVTLNGTLRLGSGGGTAGTLIVDGTMTVTGDVIFNSSASELTGAGTLDVTGDVDNTAGGTNDLSCDGTGGTTGECTCESCNPLPIRLVKFLVTTKGNCAELSWQTATEINNSGFYIERSDNGIDYKSLDFVEGAGDSNELIDYTYLDCTIERNAYYRLLQVDYDGQFDYGPVVYLTLNQLNKLSVYPNPFQDQVKISGHQGETYSIILSDVTGQALLLEESVNLFDGENLISEKLRNLNTGLYFLKFGSPESEKTFLMIKK